MTIKKTRIENNKGIITTEQKCLNCGFIEITMGNQEESQKSFCLMCRKTQLTEKDIKENIKQQINRELDLKKTENILKDLNINTI